MKNSAKTKKTESPSLLQYSYEAEKNLRQFCSLTSEELAMILATVLGEIDFALNHPDPQHKELSLKTALSASERAISIVKNLHYFSLHTRFDGRNQDLSQLVLNTVEGIEAEFKKRNIELSIRVESCLYAIVDASAIEQAILNLLWFSYYAMPHGGKLTVSLHQNLNRIELTTSDTGIGIPKDSLERVFEPYFLNFGPISETRGLGLAVTKALFEAHGGQIEVRSDLGKGTNFIAQIPYDPKLPKPVSFADKRKYKRIELSIPADISIPEKDTVRTQVSVISEGGCFIQLHPREIREFPPRDGLLSLKIYYHEDKCLEITKARVASVIESGPHCGLGLEFLEFEPKAPRILRAIVKSRGL